ncbi:hypothetical protein PLICRDRAFT_40749, partial [Plicaturopsis crispa FD-325 SS-3]
MAQKGGQLSRLVCATGCQSRFMVTRKNAQLSRLASTRAPVFAALTPTCRSR